MMEMEKVVTYKIANEWWPLMQKDLSLNNTVYLNK